MGINELTRVYMQLNICTNKCIVVCVCVKRESVCFCVFRHLYARPPLN